MTMLETIDMFETVFEEELKDMSIVSADEAAETRKSVESFLEQVEYFLDELKEKEKSWFVSVNHYGPDDDFTRVYTPIGFCSRKEAEQKCQELSSDGFSFNDDGVRAVSRDIYEKFSSLARLCMVSDSIRYDSYLSSMESKPEFESELNELVSRLRKELELNYKWEVVESVR